VERNAVNLIRGLLGLIPGGPEMFQNLQQALVIERAFQWVSTELTRLNLTWPVVRGAVEGFLGTLRVTDLANLGGVFERARLILGPIANSITIFARAASGKLLEFIFEGALALGGAAAQRVLAIFRRMGDSLRLIISDPPRFMRNLIGALLGGFRQFAGNILTHLRNAFFDWLLGALQGAGLQLPARFDLRGILSLVLQILGLTYQNLRARLVRVIGAPAVQALETGFEFVRMIATQGLAAAWQHILEQAQGFVQTLIDGVIGWVRNSIVGPAVARIAAMVIPGAGIIQGIISIYNTVMFVIEQARRIAAFVQSVLDSLGAIAQGNLGAAISLVERTLARILPLAISFLARLLNLSGISPRIREIIQRVRRPIDQALDRVVDWIVAQARRLGRARLSNIVSSGSGQRRATGDPLAARIRFRGGHETHEMWIEARGGRLHVMMASIDPGMLRERLESFEQRVTEAKRRQLDRLLRRIRLNIVRIETLAMAVQRQPGRGSSEITAEMSQLGQQVAGFLDVLETADSLEQQFGFRLTSEAYPQLDRSVEAVSGAFRPSEPPATPFRNVYLGNVPVSARNSDPTPSMIAERYYSAFASREDANMRFSLVVGVNLSEDVQAVNRRLVVARVRSIGSWSGFPLATIGFLWVPKWETVPRGGSAMSADINTVRNAYRNFPIALQSRVANYERTMLAGVRIPYGAIRNWIQHHPMTTRLMRQLRDSGRRGQELFIYFSDPDTRPFQADRGDANAALFTRYDQVLRDIETRQLDSARNRSRRTRRDEDGVPILLSGGYQFELEYAGPSVVNAGSVFANKLDAAVRRAMAAFSPLSIYYAEPNLLLRVTPQSIWGSWGNTSAESRAYVASIAQYLQQNYNAVYVRNNPVITRMDERFAVTSVDRKVTRVITRWGELRTLTWSEFEQLFAQLQSAASRSGWARAVIDNNRGYWGPGSDQNLALAYRLAEDIYDHYFPNSMVLMGRRRDIRAFRRNIRNNRFTRS
jgi:hypothetical protein